MKYLPITSVVAITMFFAFIPTIAMETPAKGMRRDSKPLTKKEIKQSSKIKKHKPATIKDIEKFNQTKNKTINTSKKNRRAPNFSTEQAGKANSQ